MKQADSRMTTAELTATGQALYGDNWIAELAKTLDYSHSTVWRWANAGMTPSRRAVKEIRGLARRKKVCVSIK